MVNGLGSGPGHLACSACRREGRGLAHHSLLLPQGGQWRGGPDLLFLMISDRTCGNGMKLCQGSRGSHSITASLFWVFRQPLKDMTEECTFLSGFPIHLHVSNLHLCALDMCIP